MRRSSLLTFITVVAASAVIAGCSSGQQASVGDEALAPSASAGASDGSAAPSASAASVAPSASAAAASASPSLLDTSPKQRTNSVNLLIGGGNSPSGTVTFVWDGGYSISPGQESTWGGVTPCGATAGGETCVVSVLAGRNNSATPMQWWQSHNVTGTVGQSVGAGFPSVGWNFAVSGSLQLTQNGTTIQYPVVLGQFYGSSHNFWIVSGLGSAWTQSPAGTATSMAADSITTADGKLEVQFSGPLINANDFLITVDG